MLRIPLPEYAAGTLKYFHTQGTQEDALHFS